MKALRMWVLGICAILSGPVMAHSDEYMDTISGEHGGQLRMAGASHYELILTPTAVQIYVTDHAGTPTPVQGATGTAMVLNGSSKQQVTLAPKGNNLLEGAGTFTPDQPVKAVVKIQLQGQEAQQTLFDSSKHKPADAHHDH